MRDEAIEGLDAGRALTAAEDLGPVHVQRGQVGPGAAAPVLVLDPHRPARRRRLRDVPTHAGLDAGLLVGADDEVVAFQALSLPFPRVEVEDVSGLGGEVRIAREDPRAVLPGADGIFGEPSPHRRVADGGHDARALRFAHEVADAQP